MRGHLSLLEAEGDKCRDHPDDRNQQYQKMWLKSRGGHG